MKKTGFALRFKKPMNKEKNFVHRNGYPIACTFMDAWISTKEELNSYQKVNCLVGVIDVVEVEITCNILSEVKELCEVYVQIWDYKDCSGTTPKIVKAGATVHLSDDDADEHVNRQRDETQHGYMMAVGTPKKMFLDKEKILDKLPLGGGFATISEEEFNLLFPDA